MAAEQGNFRDRLPDDAPLKWIDPTCRHCSDVPCLVHDKRPRTLAQNRVIFGPSFGYEPTDADRQESGL